jgi:hypothetical protein
MRPSARHSLAALCFAACALQAAAADDFGTLFTTPQERARLDKLRRGEPVAAPTVQGASPRRHALTGYVQRSDGRNTVWIDGRPVVLASPGGATSLDPRLVQPRGERESPRAAAGEGDDDTR